ncbi:MAG: triphosphoribosyl-dephospho-CoA synthase [Burkholderiaceae bacterium]|nr:triphosphoribosyl-dephospho-CoA synthase [Burkholderiaceae bacterium]
MPADPSARLVAQCFLAACELDVTALKPGNVRIGAAASGMSADDFLNSARASAPALARHAARVGERLLEAIQCTQRIVHCNTNLGIVLLAAPVFHAAEAGPPLRPALAQTLGQLDLSDCKFAYEAIRLARPGGLGKSAHHDVAAEPQVTLLEAMREAQGRDSIARQYAQGYRDIFDFGFPLWERALARFGDEAWAGTYLFLAYLSTWRDSLIERKFGAATAQAVSERAREFDSHWSSGLETMQARLLSWDEELRHAGINPGTSADLTVATVFAAKLARAV